jgi:hypothetical protein
VFVLIKGQYYLPVANESPILKPSLAIRCPQPLLKEAPTVPPGGGFFIFCILQLPAQMTGWYQKSPPLAIDRMAIDRMAIDRMAIDPTPVMPAGMK